MREAYAQKKALAKEAITNNQCMFIYVKQYNFQLVQAYGVNLLLPNMNKGVRGQQKRVKRWYWYSALSEERKRDICKIRREAYAQRTTLAKESIKNAQISSIASMRTSKEVDGPRMHILMEEDISKWGRRRKRKQCVATIDDRNEQMLKKKPKICVVESHGSRKFVLASSHNILIMKILK